MSFLDFGSSVLYHLVKKGNIQFHSPGWDIFEILSVAELGHCTCFGHWWLGWGISEKYSLAESLHEREIVLLQGDCRKNCSDDYINRLAFKIFFTAFYSNRKRRPFCTRSQLT